MTKQETPKVTEENPFVKEGKLDTELIAKFQEALKTDAAKDYDIMKEFNITAVKPETPVDSTTEPEPHADQAEIKKWMSIYENAHDALKDAGYKFETTEPQTSKMSEAQVAVNERLEKLAQSEYIKSKNSVLETDKDFPIEILDKLTGVATEDKALIMASFKEVAMRTEEVKTKLQKELTDANTKLEDPKFSAPAEDTPKDGKSRVAAARAKFGASLADQAKQESEGTKKE